MKPLQERIGQKGLTLISSSCTKIDGEPFSDTTWLGPNAPEKHIHIRVAVKNSHLLLRGWGLLVPLLA
jgi:hypothetical protein